MPELSVTWTSLQLAKKKKKKYKGYWEWDNTRENGRMKGRGKARGPSQRKVLRIALQSLTSQLWSRISGTSRVEASLDPTSCGLALGLFFLFFLEKTGEKNWRAYC